MDPLDHFYARTHDQRIGSNGGIFGQCVSGPQNFANNELGVGGAPVFPVAYAKDMFGTRPDAFDWVANTPTGVPPRSATIVFNGRMGGGAGHTGNVVDANQNQVRVYQQNDPTGSGMHVKTYNYDNVIGWGIRKGSQPTQGDIEMKPTSAKEVTDLFKTYLGYTPTSGQVDYYLNNDRRTLYYDVMTAELDQVVSPLRSQVSRDGEKIASLIKQLEEAKLPPKDPTPPVQNDPNSVNITKDSLWDWFRKLFK